MLRIPAGITVQEPTKMGSAIRHLQTGMFYREGQWTTELRFAQKFDLEAVEKVVKEERLENVEMVLVSQDGRRVRGGVRVTLNSSEKQREPE